MPVFTTDHPSASGLDHLRTHARTHRRTRKQRGFTITAGANAVATADVSIANIL